MFLFYFCTWLPRYGNPLIVCCRWFILTIAILVIIIIIVVVVVVVVVNQISQGSATTNLRRGSRFNSGFLCSSLLNATVN